MVVRFNDEGYLRGSIRGVNNSPLPDFKQFLTDSGLFEYVSGHANAAGASFREKDLEVLNKYANDELKDMDFGEAYFDVNFIRSAADEDVKDLIFDLGKYPEVWGQNCPEDRICIKDINITQNDIQVIGARKDTLKIEKFGIVYIKFFAKDLIQELSEYSGDIKLNIVGHANINTWGNKMTPQLFIDACEVLDGQYGF